MTVSEIALKCKEAAGELRLCSTEKKNKALDEMRAALRDSFDDVMEANELDIELAQKSGLSAAMIERLTLTLNRFLDLPATFTEIMAMPDPIGVTESASIQPNGLEIALKRVPLGTIGIIYESRPNVTVDAAALCIKSGNAVLLRGGKEAINTNKAIVTALRQGLENAGLPSNCVCLIEDTSRESANEMMGLTGILDVLIPRGGAGLIKNVTENSKVPIIETGVGVCHTYVDDEADLNMAVEISYNAKCSRPSVCNSMETLLVARSIANVFLPMVKTRLDSKNVLLRGCPETIAILGDEVQTVTEENYATEENDYILNIRVVGGMYQASAHIARFGTKHSEAIVTKNLFTAQRFIDRVDAACVYVNASTRFTDGGEFGLGAEIGISTQKLHARGPMGLKQLTSTKYVIRGEGQVRT